MMVLLHVDDRLAHGQIFHYWTPELQIEKVVVIDRAASQNALRKMVMQMGAPVHLKLEFHCPGVSLEEIAQWVNSEERVLCLFGSLVELSEFIERLRMELTENTDFKKLPINLGAISFGEDREKLCSSIYLNAEDYLLLMGLLEAGMCITTKNLPSDCENLLSVDGKCIIVTL